MTSGGSVRRELPGAPTYLHPVTLPTPRVGQNARIVAAENRAAAVRANRIIVDTRRWYECQREQYRTGRAVSCGM